MELFDSIYQRKSCRNYTREAFSDNKLEEIRSVIEEFTPLYPDVQLNYRFSSQTKGLYNAEAPHYLIISGQGKEGEQENTGFLFEQLVLWFDVHNIGCVWLGEAKDSQNFMKNDIITIAFGLSDKNIHREESEFKRKAIEDITNAPEDACIRAAHVAPSGMNTQPWYFEKVADKVFVYKRILKPPVSLIYKKVDIDMGIALCHYYLACKHLNKPFSFELTNLGASKKGYTLFGKID